MRMQAMRDRRRGVGSTGSPCGPCVMPRSPAMDQKRSILSETSMVTTNAKRMTNSAAMLSAYCLAM